MRWLLAFAAGCAGAGQLEVGVRKVGDGEPMLRVGASIGIGYGEPRAAPTRPVAYTFVQTIGYRDDGGVTTTSRYMRTAGPLLVRGAVEIWGDGVEVLPAFAVPVRRVVKCRYPDDECLGPYDPNGRNAIDDWSATALGLQLRVGRAERTVSLGIDAVLSLDSIANHSWKDDD